MNYVKNVTWEDFKKKVYEVLSLNNRQFLFRGQANYKWKLIPSLFRVPNIDLNNYVHNIIPEIHNILVSKWGYELYQLSDIYNFNAFLAKLQHHGFPTPLLDWTYNPYISVFFAIDDKENLDEYFSVYIFDYIAWIKKYYQNINLFDNTSQFVSTYLPNHFVNERVKIQQSIFTITNINNVEDYLLSFCEKDNCKYLIKYNFNKNEIEKIKKDLNYMGITENNMFPNLDIICNNLKKQIF